MKKLLTTLIVMVISVVGYAQDASISEFFGAELKFYAQQFDGEKYLIMKFKSSDDCIPLNQTVIKVMFMDGTETKWVGNSINSWVETKMQTYGSQNYAFSHTDGKAVNIMRFNLEDRDIESLSKGIAKISIYTVPTVFRREYEKDKLGYKLYNAFQNVKDLY